MSFRPEALERLVLDPDDRPGSSGVGDCLLQRLPTAAEREGLHVEASWRQAMEDPQRGDAAAADGFRSMFTGNPLSWANVSNLRKQKVWLAWKAVGAEGSEALCGITVTNLVDHKRNFPLPDLVARADLGRRLEQVALREGDTWPFCPCRYLGRRAPPGTCEDNAEITEPDRATAMDGTAPSEFEPAIS